MYDIRNLGENVYLVDGKVIWIQRNAFDPSAEEGRQVLCGHVDFMKNCKMRRAPYGELTADAIFPKFMSMDGTTYPVAPRHFGDLPDVVKPALRIMFSQHVNDI